MKQYVALLRGINVGGHKRMLMADVRDLFAKMWFSEVQTYIQSGNIVFSASQNAGDIQKIIQKNIQEAYGFEVVVMVISWEDFQDLIMCNPFVQEDISWLYVSIFWAFPTELAQEQILKTPTQDAISFRKNYAYISCKKYRECIFVNTFLEKSLKWSVTTRNWKTILSIGALLA